jgi:hypothetical protein
VSFDEHGGEPERAASERLSAPPVHQPPPALVGLAALGVVAAGAVLVAVAFYGGLDHVGRFAFLLMPIVGFGIRAIRSLLQPHENSEH